MDLSEYNAMVKTGKVQIRSGGVTSVSIQSQTAYPSAVLGQVYVEFDVPANSLAVGGTNLWFTLVSKSANTPKIAELNKQSGQFIENITFKNLSNIITTKK